MAQRPDTFWKQALAVFGASAVLYFGGFWFLEHLRRQRGPWELTFRTPSQGGAVVEIAAPRLRIQDVQLVFPGAATPSLTNAVVVRFDEPARREEVPFGRVKFLDTTVLPGTVTLDLFGHEVELLPRTLIVDKREHAWQPGDRIELPAR